MLSLHTTMVTLPLFLNSSTHLVLSARLPDLRCLLIFFSFDCLLLNVYLIQLFTISQVEVEVLVIQGSKLPTILTQVKKLEVSVLVLTKRNPSLFSFCGLLRSRDDEFVEQCINNAECLTLAITKQNKGVGGYLISTRWHKNFWLLA